MLHYMYNNPDYNVLVWLERNAERFDIDKRDGENFVLTMKQRSNKRLE